MGSRARGSQLQMRAVTILELEPQLEGEITGDSRLTLSGEILALSYRQLATLVSSGVTLTCAFDLLAKQEGKHTQAVMSGI